MSSLTIRQYGDPVLKERTREVDDIDGAVASLVDSMIETMYEAPGIGLAATQVDIHRRLIVIDISEDRSAPLVFINPQILSRDGQAKTEEGCLSVPGIFDDVQRAERVRVRAQDRTGEVFERDLEGFLAVCLQHEMDHLEGKLFVDYLSDIKRDKIRKKLDKERKERAAMQPRAGASRPRTAGAL